MFESLIVAGIISDHWATPRPSGPHGGVDITLRGGSYGAEIHNSSGGKVLVSSNIDRISPGGARVSIQDKNGYIHSYNHMIPGSNSHIKIGRTVERGQVIGRVGGSAYDKPMGVKPHLHYMVFDPKGNKISPGTYNTMIYRLPNKR